MQRRDFLKVTGGLSAHLIVGGSLLSIRGGGRPARPDVTALETPTEAARLTIFLFPETLADAAESIDD